MHIAVDGTALYGRYNGVEYALWNLLAALASIDETNTYTVFVPSDGPPPERWSRFGARWRRLVLPFRGAEKVRRILWQQAQLPYLLSRIGCDLLHAPTYVMPLRARLPTVLTVYDLIALTHPSFVTPANKLHYNLALRRSLRRANCIIVPSELVCQSVLQYEPSVAGKLRTVPLGVEPIFFAPVLDVVREQVKARYKLPEKFLLFVGNVEPKKNIAGLMAALSRMPNAPPLVLAGGARPWKAKRTQTASNVATLDIGYVRRRDLPALYNSCEAFIFPSLAEGFGLPVIEALASGAAVVTSNAVPLPGLRNAALVCDPRDPSSIADSISEVLGNEAIRVRLRSGAQEYARPYTWKRTAESMLKVYGEFDHAT